MPYIKQERRARYDYVISNILSFLQEMPEEDRDGELNYLISVLLKRAYKPLAYKRINRAMGLLECIKQEYYRVVAGPYEEEKRKTQGDVE